MGAVQWRVVDTFPMSMFAITGSGAAITPPDLVSKHLQVVHDTEALEIDSFKFYPGEDRVLRLKVESDVDGTDLAIPVDATVEVFLPTISGGLVLAPPQVTVDANDNSLLVMALDQDQTRDLMTGEISVHYAVAGQHYIACGQWTLKKLRSALA